MIQVVAWIAIIVLATSHWIQVYKIHKHREVRDISIWTYLFLLAGYTSLFVKATVDWLNGSGDVMWAFKQMATIIPVTVVLFQILQHYRDTWHDDDDPYCVDCSKELEPHWSFCPYCSAESPQ